MIKGKTNITETVEKSKGLFRSDVISDSGIVTKQDLDIEINAQFGKKIFEVSRWAFTVLLAAVFGYIINTVWSINADIHFLQGKFASPDNVINHISNRIEALEIQNKILSDSLHKLQINELQSKVDLLSSELNNKSK